MTPRSTSTRSRLVLAVDDEEDHLLAYEVAFGREPDLRLITATNTHAAGIALRTHGVDAMLLDLSIPEDGGIALCRRIKAQPRFLNLPVIALSALPADIYAASALAAGCCAFLQKPCSLSNIVAEVRRRLAPGDCGGPARVGARLAAPRPGLTAKPATPTWVLNPAQQTAAEAAS